MSVPVLQDGSAGVADGVSQLGSYVELRAERNGYNPTPIRVVVYKPIAALERV